MRNIILFIAYTLLALPFLLNARSSKGIFNAVQKGQVNRIQSEVNKGASIDAYNKDGLTPLMVAVKENKPAMARALLQAGADPERTTRSSRNAALHMAAELGNKRMIKILNPYNADPTRMNTEGETAADIAQKKRHTKIV